MHALCFYCGRRRRRQRTGLKSVHTSHSQSHRPITRSLTHTHSNHFLTFSLTCSLKLQSLQQHFRRLVNFSVWHRISHNAHTPLTPAVVKVVRKAVWRDPAWLRILYGICQKFHGFLSLTLEQTEKWSLGFTLGVDHTKARLMLSPSVCKAHSKGLLVSFWVKTTPTCKPYRGMETMLMRTSPQWKTQNRMVFNVLQ